jgi:hypothetical protein
MRTSLLVLAVAILAVATPLAAQTTCRIGADPVNANGHTLTAGETVGFARGGLVEMEGKGGTWIKCYLRAGEPMALPAAMPAAPDASLALKVMACDNGCKGLGCWPALALASKIDTLWAPSGSSIYVSNTATATGGSSSATGGGGGSVTETGWGDVTPKDGTNYWKVAGIATIASSVVAVITCVIWWCRHDDEKPDEKPQPAPVIPSPGVKTDSVKPEPDKPPTCTSYPCPKPTSSPSFQRGVPTPQIVRAVAVPTIQGFTPVVDPIRRRFGFSASFPLGLPGRGW